jgi:hypothetical protein
MKHTPGPWEAVKTKTRAGESAYYIEETSQRAVVATVPVCCGWESANAGLVAAAPELLAACEAIRDCFTPELSGSPAFADLIEAIAKAKGEK